MVVIGSVKEKLFGTVIFHNTYFCYQMNYGEKQKKKQNIVELFMAESQQ